MKIKFFLYAATLGLLAASCTTSTITKSGLDPENFVTTKDGAETALYTLENKNGMEVCLTNYGGRIVSIMAPDRDGKLRDVVLGFDNVKDYMEIDNNFGATIGRYGNRINQGKITIEGVEYQLPKNNFGHCLHGGPNGYDHKIMDAEVLAPNAVRFSWVSPDGEANFPGTVHANVTMTLSDDNALELKYTATTDKTTILNLTNHSYFNLKGEPDKGGMDQIMYVNADGITPIDKTFMTSGEITPVENTPFDFRTPKMISKDIDAEDEQLANGRGYDHNWVLNTNGTIQEVAASLYSEESGILMEVYTDEPGIQIYTGNFLNGKVYGKAGKQYVHRASVCLETQHYPDSPNKEQWPSVIVKPGETYTSTCIYKFSVR